MKNIGGLQFKGVNLTFAKQKIRFCDHYATQINNVYIFTVLFSLHTFDIGTLKEYPFSIKLLNPVCFILFH